MPFLTVAAAHGALIPVYNTNDQLVGSLRQAILDADPAGGDTIVFQIPATDPGYNLATAVFTITRRSKRVSQNKPPD